MKKLEKSLFVQNFTEELKSATSVVLINYEGLTVKMQQELKKRLKEAGASMLVAKNTLFARAGHDAKLPEQALTDSVLKGPSAYVITEADPIAPLQIISKFASEFEIPQFKVGVVEGKYQDKDSLTKLSTLPSKEVLFAQTVGAVSAPLYGIVGVLQGNLQKLVYILKTKSNT